MPATGNEALLKKQALRYFDEDVPTDSSDDLITLRQLRALVSNTPSVYPAIPDDYQALTFIQSTGSQYIDSEYTPNSNSRIVYTCDRVEEAAADHYFGVRTGNGNNKGFSFYIYNSGWRSGYGSQIGTASNTPSGFYKIDKNKNVTTINTDQHVLTSNSETFTCDGTAYLFAMNNVGISPAYGKQRLYSCQMYDNDVLVRNFVPCLRIVDDVAGLYDTVNNTFYENSGTGSFEIGPYIEKPNAILDKKVVRLSQFKRLCISISDYVMLEWIRGSGGMQKIDTGTKTTQNTRIVMDTEIGSLNNATPGAFFLGSIASETVGGGRGMEVYIYGGAIYTKYCHAGIYYSVPSTLVTGDRILIDLNKNVHSVTKNDGSVVFNHTYNPETFTSYSNLFLNSLERNYYGDNKIFSCQIYENDVLVRNFVPCRRKSDGAVGLYDKKSKTFYGNAGTGAFIPGPVLGPMKNTYKYLEYV